MSVTSLTGMGRRVVQLVLPHGEATRAFPVDAGAQVIDVGLWCEVAPGTWRPITVQVPVSYNTEAQRAFMGAIAQHPECLDLAWEPPEDAILEENSEDAH